MPTHRNDRAKKIKDKLKDDLLASNAAITGANDERDEALAQRYKAQDDLRKANARIAELEKQNKTLEAQYKTLEKTFTESLRANGERLRRAQGLFPIEEKQEKKPLSLNTPLLFGKSKAL